MARLAVSLVVGVALLVLAVGALVWAWPYASVAQSLYRFEQEEPTQVRSGSAQQGAGLLGLDVVTLEDGRTLSVHRQGEPRVQWPRPAFLVGDHGARLADEPPASGVWGPFALRAAIAAIVGLLAAGAAVPVLRTASRRAGTVIFGQRAPDSTPVGWVPGGGTHGGMGGQVPPHVPYNRDWDPDRRIR